MESAIVNFRNSTWRYAFRGPFYLLSAKLAMDSVMSFPETLFTFLFGVGLPSWDVYSDLIFALKLAIPRCYDYEAYHYYEKYYNWSRKYIIFRGIFDKAKMFLKCLYFLEGNCKYNEQLFECPETNKCIWRENICNGYNNCEDGSDELHCSGKSSEILSII